MNALTSTTFSQTTRLVKGLRMSLLRRSFSYYRYPDFGTLTVPRRVFDRKGVTFPISVLITKLSKFSLLYSSRSTSHVSTSLKSLGRYFMSSLNSGPYIWTSPNSHGNNTTIPNYWSSLDHHYCQVILTTMRSSQAFQALASIRLSL
jgi:hypothetical protein